MCVNGDTAMHDCVHDVYLGHEQLLCPVQIHQTVSTEEKRERRGHWQEIVSSES